MCEHLVRLNGEAKVLRRFGDPVLDGHLFYQLAEGVVDFDGIQFRCVEAQKFLLRKFLGIESGLPCRISPSGGANVKMRHRLLDAFRLLYWAPIQPQRLKPEPFSATSGMPEGIP